MPKVSFQAIGGFCDPSRYRSGDIDETQFDIHLGPERDSIARALEDALLSAEYLTTFRSSDPDELVSVRIEISGLCNNSYEEGDTS